MLENNKKLKEDVGLIMELGVDCNTYIKFAKFIGQIDAQASNNDENAKKIVEVVHQFARLIRVAIKKDT